MWTVETRYFGVPETIKNEDFDMVVTTTTGLLKESANKKISDPKNLAKLIPILKDVVKTSVGFETHRNRYFSDNDTTFFYNLIGGYADGNYFVPVRFGVKASRNGKNYLYVIIDNEQIKMAVFFAGVTSQNVKKQPTDSANFNIADIFSKVNSPEIIKYVPDNFLDESQRKAKYEAIADTVKRTNDKNDRKYAEFISKGNLDAAQRMAEAAAKNAFANTKMGDKAKLAIFRFSVQDEEIAFRAFHLFRSLAKKPSASLRISLAVFSSAFSCSSSRIRFSCSD